MTSRLTQSSLCCNSCNDLCQEPHDVIYSLLQSTAGCWNKVNQLILTWQAFADLNAKAPSSGLREMLN